MRAKDLALQNFTVANHLLDLYQLLNDLHSFDPGQDYKLAICQCMNATEGAIYHHTKNERILCSVLASFPLPSCLIADQGMNFLLRQSILVAASALESYFWDVVRENALTVIRARGRKADKSLKDITLTIDDYLSIEEWEDPDERLRQIILNRYERGTLYDLKKITELANILGVPDFWNKVSKNIGTSTSDINTKIQNLITRRNQIAHRADRPDETDDPGDIDPHGLRKISFSWAHGHVSFARTFVDASSELFEESMKQMNELIERRKEQQLAQQTLKGGL